MQLTRGYLATAVLLVIGAATPADASIYWSLFNIEGETAQNANYVTYATLTDMLTDTNRLQVYVPSGGFAGQNVVGSGSDGSTYLNLFNIEGETAQNANYVTYATLTDMLTDTNRLQVYVPSGGFAGQNVVGSGSDGSTYWNLFNIEGETAQNANYVTYATLTDMLMDTNRLQVYVPSGGFAGQNVVGSGSDGSTYWTLFNIEGETAQNANYVTYGSLLDMLLDTNRLGVFVPSGGFAGQNVVGSGAFVVPIPAPAAVWLLLTGLAAFASVGMCRQRALSVT